ncbi:MULTISPECIES: hypothetical protein [unclassified Actinotalea]|uniref:hypothetical protein n=1 Tax=unclassified Actinotalea TaxID=2638618 RepID=UPI0015F69A89|nr:MULTISPECIES: hypothetical protein [unclassified Actinotalea]
MSSTTNLATIVSGVPYVVRTLDGRPPVSIDEFAADVSMVVVGPTGEHTVAGCGDLISDGTVRLYQKDNDGTGKDIRVWTVSASPSDDGFVAVG